MQNNRQPELRYNKRGREGEKVKGEQDALCPIPSPPSPNLGWLSQREYL